MKTAGIERVVLLHADAIAEDGPAAERARRIDGDHADGPLGGPEPRDEPVHQGRLAGAGWAGDASVSACPRRG